LAVKIYAFASNKYSIGKNIDTKHYSHLPLIDNKKAQKTNRFLCF